MLYVIAMSIILIYFLAIHIVLILLNFIGIGIFLLCVKETFKYTPFIINKYNAL